MSKMNDRILIIDDEIDICFLLSGMLRSMSFQCTYSNTLGEGFEKIKDFQPQIIFLDINLPDGSGLDAISHIKLLVPEARIIMISAYDGINERTRASHEGASGFISKPFNKEVVSNVLKEQMNVLQPVLNNK